MTISKEMAEEVAAMANLIEIATKHGTKFARFAAEANKRIDEMLKELDDPSQDRRYPRAVTPPAGPADSQLQLEPGQEPVQIPQSTPGSEPLGRRDGITGEAVHGGLSQSRPASEVDAEAEKAREAKYKAGQESVQRTQEMSERDRQTQREQVQRSVPEGDPRGRPDPTPGQPVPGSRDPNTNRANDPLTGQPSREDLKKEYRENLDKPDPNVERRV